MRKWTALFMVMLLLLTVTACNKGAVESTDPAVAEFENSLIGKWVWVGDDQRTIQFQKNGTCVYSGALVNYSVDAEKRTVTLNASQSAVSFALTEIDGVQILAGTANFVREADYAALHAQFECEQGGGSDQEKMQYILTMYDKFTAGRDELKMDCSYWLSAETEQKLAFYTKYVEIIDSPRGIYLSLRGTVVNLTYDTVKFEYTQCNGDSCVLTDVGECREEKQIGQKFYRFTSYQPVLLESLEAHERVECFIILAELRDEFVNASTDAFGGLTGWITLNFKAWELGAASVDSEIEYYFDLKNINAS